MAHLISSKWMALTVTGLAVILSLTTWFSATAVTPELTRAMALTPSQAAWLTNAVQAGFVAGALGSSFLSLTDALRLTWLMAAASASAALFNGLLLLEPGIGVVIVARVLTGMALALVYPPSLKFIATWFRTGRGLAMGAMVGALTLGSALPHLVRGTGGEITWPPVIVASSLACLAAAAIFGLVLHEGPHSFSRTRVNPRQLGAIVRNRPVMLANLGYFGHMWELYAMWGWLLAYMAAAQADGLALGNVSLLTFAVVAMGAPGCLLAGWLADRIGRCTTTALAMCISGTSALLIGATFGGPVWAFALVALVWGMTVIADSAQFSAAVTELSDQSLVGSALAFQMGVGFFITIFAIWLVPLLAETLGSWRWTFLILAPGPAIGAWAMLTLRRHPAAALIAGGNR